jgi:CDP-diacylglycerol--glycerol-3-phosphate 3-phosphatidyltransferase
VPNLLTAGRFFMAIGFFVVLAFYQAEREAAWPVLDVALVIFLVAVATDVVDGYLARRMGHQTTFGRIADPFVDKIIICGAMVYFIGGEFIRRDGVNVTGWQTWMVVVVLARELLVTGMRSFSESHSIPFAATLSGKVKMFLQCVAVTWVLLYVGHWARGGEAAAWATIGRDISIWTATLFTGLSGLVYIKRAYHLLRLPAQ